MIWKLIIEIMILWVIYALYMELLVRKRGPVGGTFFYPKAVQERVFDLGLMTREEYRKRKTFAYVLLLLLMILVPSAMILFVNKAETWWSCTWQYYVLFLGAEFYDWLFIDTIWVALSDWWLIPGTEDLNSLWHSPKVKAWKMPKLMIFAVPLSALMGTFCWLFGMVIS